MNEIERIKRRKRDARRATLREAHDDRYAYVCVICDRKTFEVTVEHPWLSPYEAKGILEEALDVVLDPVDAKSSDD